MSAPRLYHYTCADHGQPGIARTGEIKPGMHPWLRFALVWVTDLDEPHREALGLTSQILDCDRTAFRFEVHPLAAQLCIPWSTYARRLSRGVRDRFEETPGAMPAHWWVSETSLLAVLPAGVTR